MTAASEIETSVDAVKSAAKSFARANAAQAIDAEFAAEERRLWNPTPELLEALVAAMAEMGMASKSGHNTHDRYDYGTLEDYLAAARPALLKHGLLLVSRPVSAPEYGEMPTKTGKWRSARVLVETRVVHAATQGWIAARVWGEGADRGDKAVYKALTGGRKYSIAMVLGIYTTDEPEHDSPEATGGNQQPKGPLRRPAAPPVDKTWTADKHGRFLGRVPGIGTSEEQTPFEQLDKAVTYLLEHRDHGMSDEQFQEASHAVFARAEVIDKEGRLAEEDRASLLAKVSSAFAPTTTAAQMPAQEEQPTE